MKIKVSEASGRVLDYLVAVAIGHVNGFPENLLGVRVKGFGHERIKWQPSTDWSQGGPIIEREDISFRKYHNLNSATHGTFYARICKESGTLVGWYKTTGCQQTGPTPLVAAMRCYVASKLGDEVEVPEELL